MKFKEQIIKTAFLTMLAGCLLPTVTYAQGEGMGYTSYYFTDSGGNSVTTNAFNLAKRIFEKTVFLLDLEVDNVFVPPVSAVTGATRPQRQSNKPFEKTRGQAILGIEQGLSVNSSLAVNLYRSQEIDYVSNSIIGTLSRDFNQQNTKLSMRGQFIDDRVGKILDDGDIVNQKKWSFWGLATFSQILSSTTVFDVTYDVLLQQGFLSDPYRQVKVFDINNAFTTTDELHPDNRLRHALTSNINKLMPQVKASLRASYRYYFDDWEISSHTVDFQFSKYIVDDFITRFNYRYYSQTGSFFYEDRYVGDDFLNDAYRTSDYKLRAFNSNNFGISLTYLLRGLAESKPDFNFLEKSSLELRFFRYFNTLDFSANIYQLNINFGI